MKRIYHTWDEWECYPAGFYESRPPKGMTDEDCRAMYAAFLRDEYRFRDALQAILVEWPNSCEHYLTNANMNRIAWLGQASMCYATGVPANFRGGFNRLTTEEQEAANLIALEALNTWLAEHGEEPVTLDGAKSRTEMDLY